MRSRRPAPPSPASTASPSATQASSPPAAVAAAFPNLPHLQSLDLSHNCLDTFFAPLAAALPTLPALHMCTPSASPPRSLPTPHCASSPQLCPSCSR
eukprot:jgi/Ulvmu1/10709/UM067_0035.1